MIRRSWLRGGVAIAASAAIAATVAGPAAAGPADLDASFGSGGIATLAVPAATTGLSTVEVTAMALDPAGDVLLAGDRPNFSGSSLSTDLIIGRLTASGAPDGTFGTNGVVMTTVPGGAAVAGLAPGPGGTVIAAVDAVDLSSLAITSSVRRFTAAGGVDATFGTSGDAPVQPSMGAVLANAVAVDGTGNVLVGGGAAASEADEPTPFVERFTASGSPDSAFGSGGVATTPGPGIVSSVALPVGGGAVVGVAALSGMSISKLTSTGGLDTTFGEGGTATVDSGALSELRTVLAAPDGSVVAAGRTGTDALVAKLTPTGAPDAAFGVGGVVAVSVPGDVAALSGAALDPSGNIVVGGPLGAGSTLAALIGLISGSSTPTSWVARLLPDGTPDRTFAARGVSKVVTPATTLLNVTVGPVLTPSGQPILGGSGATLDTSGPVITEATSLAATRLAGGTGTAIPAANAVSRLAGPDRVATAIAVSQATFATAQPFGSPPATQDAAGGVIVASADNFPDALVGTPLAAAESAPLLLTHSASLDPRDAAEIRRVLGDPSAGGEVTVLGGPAAIADPVIGQIADLGYSVRRLAGVDRYDTALKVAEDVLGQGPLAIGASASGPARVPLASRLFTAGHYRQAASALSAGRVQQLVSILDIGPPIVFEATGTNYPDALAAGAAAAHVGGVVLLTNAAVQSPATEQFLLASGAVRYAIGAQAAAADRSATAVAGVDRYDTAAKVAATFFPTPPAVGVATGTGYADALAGGARAALEGEPILLTDPVAMPRPVSDYLTKRAPWIDTADVYGGGAAVSDAVLGAVKAAIS